MGYSIPVPEGFKFIEILHANDQGNESKVAIIKKIATNKDYIVKSFDSTSDVERDIFAELYFHDFDGCANVSKLHSAAYVGADVSYAIKEKFNKLQCFYEYRTSDKDKSNYARQIAEVLCFARYPSKSKVALLEAYKNHVFRDGYEFPDEIRESSVTYNDFYNEMDDIIETEKTTLGVTIGDIKKSNLMIDSKNKLCIFDFGRTTIEKSHYDLLHIWNLFPNDMKCLLLKHYKEIYYKKYKNRPR